MFEEPIRFFVDLVRNDRPVDEFLDGRHTFVNPALARHYGMPEPDRAGRTRGCASTTPIRYGRGGLLPMAVFLTKNSPGLRTSPVKRGYWVVRRLLGENIPAPPANVPDLPDDEAKLGDLTLREALARHRADASCAGCHERFDAIGLAFEGYGPGRRGSRRSTSAAGRSTPAATFPGGGEGDGVEGLAHLPRDEPPGGVRRQPLPQAAGLRPRAEPAPFGRRDRSSAMRQRLAADGGRFGGLVEAIVTSPQFRNKRIEGEQAE